VLLVLLVGGTAVYAVAQLSGQRAADTSGANRIAVETPSISPSPSTAPLVMPLTGQMGGQYCPVGHPHEDACWRGSLLNTGPVIGKLAITFVVEGGYENWFAHHANATLLDVITTPGCNIDAANHQIICGSLAPGRLLNVELDGYTTTRGTFRYAVKFSDISSGSPVYLNQRPDGTHEVVSWTEVIT
jgi:hypothetical protein